MKKKLTDLVDIIVNFVKYNRQFCSYVGLSLLCTTAIRVITLGNLLEPEPLIFDLACILIIGSFGFFYKPQKQFPYFFGALLFFAIVGLINQIYFSFYSSFSSISLLTTIGQVKDVSDAAFANLSIFQFMYLLAPLIFYFIHRRLNNRDYFNFVAKFEKSRSLFKKILITGVIFIFICCLSLSATAFSRLAKQWNREYIFGKFGMVVYHLNDLVNTLKPTIVSWFGYDVALRSFNDYFIENPALTSNNEYTGIFEGKSVIFVHMESFSSFLLDLAVNDQMITPNLNQLYDEGLSFTNFYPQTGVGTSSDTEFTINTSLMPPQIGTAFVTYFNRTYIAIPNLLKEKGYYTFSMHGNKASMWNRSQMHPSLGYMDFYSKPSFNIDELVGLGISDKSFFKQLIPMIEEIETNNEKYMGTIITLSNHTPFENNELFTDLDLTYQGEEAVYDYLEGSKLGEYFISSHYADEALGEFLAMVKNSEYFNDTIFVFYGDHDPRFSAKEYYNYYNFNQASGEVFGSEEEGYINYDYFANELNRKTPLIIWSKNKNYKQKIDYYMGSIDILPTLGNMLGFQNPYALGHDIFEIKNNNIVAFPNGNFLTNKIYYNNSKEEYKVISTDETLSDDYIQSGKEYTEKLLELSNGIIMHDLIKKGAQKEK